MRRNGIACGVIVVVLLSACGEASHTNTGANKLSASLRSYIHGITSRAVNGKVNAVDVYGPGSHSALVEASSADSVPDHRKGFYLVIFHGHFTCWACNSAGPTGGQRPPPPHESIEFGIWSPRQGETDDGMMKTLPRAVTMLHRLATITVS